MVSSDDRVKPVRIPGSPLAGAEPARIRVACHCHDRLVSMGIIAAMAQASRLEVVPDPDPGAAVLVIHVDQAREGFLEWVRGRCKQGPTVTINPLAISLEVLGVGARGVVDENAAPDELFEVIREVATGKRTVSTAVMDYVLDQFPGRPLTLESLTPYQRAALGLLAAGQPLTVIARELGVSRQAVSQMLERLRHRAQLRTNRDLIRFARDHSLLH